MSVNEPAARSAARRTWRIAIGAAIALPAILALALLLKSRLRISDEQLESRMIAAVQREAPQSFLVTGSIDMTATVTVRNVKRFLPGLLDVDLGTARAMVQVPGRAFYGFDVRRLDASRIRVRADTVEIIVPQPAVLSVDANLEELRVWSDKGWLRSHASRAAVEQSAIRRIDGVLRRQAERHVGTASQPRVNSAEAIRKAVDPVLRAAGVREPVYRFRITETLTLD